MAAATRLMLLDARTTPLESAPAHGQFRSVWRSVFSFPAVIAVFLLLLTVFTIRGRFNDPDLWWHLKTGEIIWNTHRIPTVDSFSFTAGNHPYIPHEWLSQLSIYMAYRLDGYSGVMLWFCVAASLLVIAGYALCSVYSGNSKVAFLGGLLVWLFATVGLSIRPQMLGYLFLVCELLILHLGHARDRRYFLLLPPLFLVWVNCHGSFFLGLIVLAVTLACSFVELAWGLLVSHRWDRRERRALIVASLLSIAALFVNPVGFRQVIYPFDTLFHQTQQMNGVAEWLPPRFDELRGVALLILAALVLLIPLLRRAELTPQEFLLVSLAFGLAVRHQRLLFIFGIFAGPVLCRLLADCWERYEPQRDRPVTNAIFIAAVLMLSVLAFPTRRQLNAQIEAGNPVKAVDFINASGLTGNMLNEYVYGGYLIWAAPRHKVFVDGRGDIFEWTGVLKDYLDWEGLKTDPTILLNRYSIQFCLLPRTSAMSRVLPLLPGWKRIYSDKLSDIFARFPALAK